MSAKLSTAVVDNESCTISPPQPSLLSTVSLHPQPTPHPPTPSPPLHSLQHRQGVPTELLQEWVALKHGLFLQASCLCATGLPRQQIDCKQI